VLLRLQDDVPSGVLFRIRMVYLGLVLSDVQILNEFWLGPLVLVILPLSHERGFVELIVRSYSKKFDQCN